MQNPAGSRGVLVFPTIPATPSEKSPPGPFPLPAAAESAPTTHRRRTMFARITLAASLTALALCATTATAQTKTGGSTTQPGGNGPRPSGQQPADLILANMQINEAAKTVTVAVRLEARIGLRGV